MADPALLETLSTLSTQVDTLSEALSPLLKVPYSEWIEQHDQQPLNKAKLDVTISYALHDLIWVYLKTSGVDPTNHPVMQEIERLKGYFAKLKSAESGQATNEPGSSTDKRRMQIDKQAASRFINHAIASQKSKVDSNYSPGDDSEDAELGVGGSGTHTRFDEEGEEDEGDDVLDGVEKNEEVERLLESDTLEVDDQGEDDEEENKKASKKGKRKNLDPFAGYDQPKPSTTTEKRKLDSTEGGGASKTTTTSASSTLRNKLKTIESNPSSGTNSATSPNKKAKKKDKQKKLKLKK